MNKTASCGASLAAFLLCLLVANCATTVKAKYTKKDHFTVGKYEVGALEYEDAQQGTYKRIWSFPVYLEGKKVKTYHFQTQSTSSYKQEMSAQKQFDAGAKVARVRIADWALLEESLDGKMNIVKIFDTGVVSLESYEYCKECVIKALKNE